MGDDNIPVVIGVGRITQRTGGDISHALDPIQLMAAATRKAAADAVDGAHVSSDALLANVKSVNTVLMLMEDRVPKGVPPFYRNAPLCLAHAVGAHPHAHCATTHHGGHAPQLLINELAERLAQGRFGLGLVAGGECMDTFMRATRAGRISLPGGAAVRDAVGRKYESDANAEKLVWGDASDSPVPESIGKNMRIATVHEAKHGLAAPATAYALLDQALRSHFGRSLQEQELCNAELFAGFSRVAANEGAEFAWFPNARTASELATITTQNRAVTRPGYPKYMNSILEVDQCAAVLLATVGEARRLGVPASKWIYLHGCADTLEEPYSLVSRKELHRSHAMAEMGREVTRSSGVPMEKVELFDIYSCFPSAVQMACRELGLGERNGDQLTQTGGLCYHGGPGNSYSLFAVVAMCEKLRMRRGAFGLVTANGGWVTKHSAGLYSTTPYSVTHPGATRWQRRNPEEVQQRIRDAAQELPVPQIANGRGVIEVYTVEHDRSGPSRAIVVGTLLDGDAVGQRFVATSKDKQALTLFLSKDCIGIQGVVMTNGDRCSFVPDGADDAPTSAKL